MWGWIDRIPEYTPVKKRYMVRAEKNDEFMTFFLEERNEKEARKHAINRGYNVLYVKRLSWDDFMVQTEGEVILFSKR